MKKEQEGLLEKYPDKTPNTNAILQNIGLSITNLARITGSTEMTPEYADAVHFANGGIIPPANWGRGKGLGTSRPSVGKNGSSGTFARDFKNLLPNAIKKNMQ